MLIFSFTYVLAFQSHKIYAICLFHWRQLQGRRGMLNPVSYPTFFVGNTCNMFFLCGKDTQKLWFLCLMVH